jgi:fatty-acyl-CoA synthase
MEPAEDPRGCGSKSWKEFRATYRDLWDLSGRAARRLLARGVAAGDRVGIWAPNRHEWVIA